MKKESPLDEVIPRDLVRRRVRQYSVLHGIDERVPFADSCRHSDIGIRSRCMVVDEEFAQLAAEMKLLTSCYSGVVSFQRELEGYISSVSQGFLTIVISAGAVERVLRMEDFPTGEVVSTLSEVENLLMRKLEDLEGVWRFIREYIGDLVAWEQEYRGVITTRIGGRGVPEGFVERSEQFLDVRKKIENLVM